MWQRKEERCFRGPSCGEGIQEAGPFPQENSSQEDEGEEEG